MTARTTTTPAIGAAALTAALVALLCCTTTAAAARPAHITGRLDQRGYVLVALSSGRISTASARGRFELAPPGRRVTLHLLRRDGAYFGPLVTHRVRAGAKTVVVGVRAGARLGTVRVAKRHRYAYPVRKLRPPWVDARRRARVRGGRPIAAGRVFLARATKRQSTPSAQAPPSGRALAAAGCPLLLCPQTGSFSVDVSEIDEANAALAVAILAAALAALSLALHWRAALRRRRRGVEVFVRLGLPIYQQGDGEWAVFIEIVNRAEHPIRWTSAVLEAADGRALYLMQYPPGGELPAVIHPNDSHHTWMRCPDIERNGMDLSEPVVGVVKLAGGDMVRSKPRRLVKRKRILLRLGSAD
jgi:hypothetical protein